MKKLLFAFILLILLTACTPESDIDNGVGTQEDDTADSTTTSDEEDTAEETGRFSLDDFPYGAEKIVYYTGFATENNIKMASSYTEYFINEEDRTYSQDYTFDVARVYYGDMSILYIFYLQGSVGLEYLKTTEQISTETTTSASISDSAQDSATLSVPVKIGQIDADGEIYFSISPKLQSFSNTCTIRNTYSDGTSTTSESSACDYEGLDIGGGSDEQCQPTTGDQALSNAGSCKLYIAADGSTSGSFSDSIYTSEETSNSNQIRQIEWALTPNEPIEEPIYLQ